jgi:ubiquinone/menaquinone biosynthesis C-methylase UbiE
MNKKKYFAWDTNSWSRALNIWHKYLELNIGNYALEIGGRDGGLSLMLAKEFGMKVVCSDLQIPKKNVKLLHQKHKTDHEIQYEAVDCTRIVYRDNTFDVVIFKSVIGALGTNKNQSLAFQEIHRVLKPGGVLLFAENIECSIFHVYLRRIFTSWSHYWHYPKLNDINLYLKNFIFFEIKTTGFFALFSKNEFINTCLSYLDVVIEKILPKKNRYIVYGAAIK